MTARKLLTHHDTTASGEPLLLPARSYEVQVELGNEITAEELRHDLDADPFHWLLEFTPRVTHTASGRLTVDLTIPGPDIWTTALTTMAVLRQSGYSVHALHLVTQEFPYPQSVW